MRCVIWYMVFGCGWGVDRHGEGENENEEGVRMEPMVADW